MKFVAYLTKHGLPLVAVLVGVTAALSGFGRRAATTARAEPGVATKAAGATAQSSSGSPALSLPLPLPAEEDANPGQSISGVVLEQIDVEKYSYLRLGEKGKAGTWAAVPSAPSRLGERVTVTNAEVMTDFASATLKRTFDTIYFGLLDAPSLALAEADVAQGRPSEPSHAAGAPMADSAAMQPHPGPGPAADRVVVGQVKRASGPLAHTVAELNSMRSDAAGSRARVRAIVVKSTSGVLARTFLHVRDGSGEASTGANDLAVTTSVELAVGTEVALEGTVEVDKDFGSGYRYRVLLADATPVAD